MAGKDSLPDAGCREAHESAAKCPRELLQLGSVPSLESCRLWSHFLRCCAYLAIRLWMMKQESES